MLKGKTLIELTDVKTGNVERFEDENIITNAVDLYVRALTAITEPSKLKTQPLGNYAFGGIKLFESTIEESADNWHMPSISQNKVIGYASRDTTEGTDPRRGSGNIAETTPLKNGMQFVWDFATSEANGTISCVCLTSSEGGKASYFPAATPEHYDMNIYPDETLLSYHYMLGYNVNTEEVIGQYIKSSVTYARKAKLYLDNIPLDKRFACPEPTIPDIENGGFQSNNGMYHVDYDGNIEQISVSGSNIYIERFDAITCEKITDLSKNFTIENASVQTNESTTGIFLRHRVFDGKIFLEKTNSKGYYIVDYDNTSNVSEVSYDGEILGTKDYIVKMPNGDMIANGMVFNPTSLDYEMSVGANNLGSGIVALVEKEGFLLIFMKKDQSSGNSFCRIIPNYMALMSINNLETPVTKTADKTMKITYTLTYTN